jgi:hypothetical protein
MNKVITAEPEVDAAIARLREENRKALLELEAKRNEILAIRYGILKRCLRCYAAYDPKVGHTCK